MKRLFLIPTLFLSITITAQTEAQTETNAPKTIRSTFDDMLNKSNRYQDFKVVKRVYLDSFIKEVQDSLDLKDKNYANEIKAKNDALAEVAGLKETIAKGELRITELEGQRDGIETVGMQMDKGTFSTMMWIAVLGLLGLLVALFLRNKSIASSQRGIKNNLNDLEEELSQVKKKALEREQELKREVQDYVNKLEAMGPPK